MIFTECPYCDEPACYPLQDEFLGKFRRDECEKCGETYFVQMTRLPDGVTLSKEEFIKRGGVV